MYYYLDVCCKLTVLKIKKILLSLKLILFTQYFENIENIIINLKKNN